MPRQIQTQRRSVKASGLKRQNPIEASAHMGFDFPWEILIMLGQTVNKDIDLEEESVEQVHI